MAVEHKEGCWYPRVQEEERRYHEAYPKACDRCEGWGGASFYERDTGYQGYDPCPECLEKGKCPRCGWGVISETLWDAGQLAQCDNCGFLEGVTRGYTYVEDPCSCPGMNPAWPYEPDWWLYGQSAPREAADAGEPEEPYPYELSDHLYDAWRERGRH